MGNSNKKLVILGVSAGVLLVAVVVLACIFFFAPVPADAAASIDIPSEFSSEDMVTSDEVPSEPVSAEEPSSEEPSSEAPIPSYEEPSSVASKPKPATSTAPKPKPKPTPAPTPSSKPAPPPPSSKPTPPPSSEPPASTAVKLSTGSTEVTIDAGSSKTFYLDIPDNYSIYTYPEDKYVSVTTNPTTKEITITVTKEAAASSRVGIECTDNAQEASDYIFDLTVKTVGGVPAGVTGLTAAEVASYTNDLLQFVNQTRADYGLADLSISSSLNTGAQTRAYEAPRTFSGSGIGDHPRPDGSNWNTVYSDYKSYYMGENMAQADKGAFAVDIFEEWKASSAHRECFLNPNYTTTGFGFCIGSDEKLYIVEHFRGPANN